VLKGIQTKRERAIATGGQIKLQLEELYNFWSLNIIKVTESGILRWTEHLAHTREMRNASKFLLDNVKGKTIWMAVGVGGRLLKRVLEKWG
jgi:hypothetical protein